MAAPLPVPIAHNIPKPGSADRETVAAILARCKTSLIAHWLMQTKRTPELNHPHLSDERRTGHLPRLVDDIVARLGKTDSPTKDADAVPSPAAVEHGTLRRTQGYPSGMLIQSYG